MSTKRVTDYHEFTVLRYEDDSVDIACQRDEFDVDYHTAYLEANVLCRSMGEELQSSEEYCTVRVYTNGTVCTLYRDGAETVGWQQYKWVQTRLAEAGYNGLLGYRRPAQWVLTALIWLQYVVARYIGGPALPQGEPDDEVMPGEVPPAAVAAPATQADQLGTNVVQFRPRA